MFQLAQSSSLPQWTPTNPTNPRLKYPRATELKRLKRADPHLHSTDNNSNMDFTSPSEADVDMAIHDDGLIDMNLGAQYPPHDPARMGNGLADTFNVAGMIPGVMPMVGNGQQPTQPQPQGFPSIEDYAKMNGIKLEGAQDEMPNISAMSMQPAMNPFPQVIDPAKIQANTEFLNSMYGTVGIMPDTNPTSMTLPANLGSGVNPFMHPGELGAAAPPPRQVYDNATELVFNPMNPRPYDPSTGYNPAVANPMGIQKPAMHRMLQQPPMHDTGAHTLSPEVLSLMMSNQSGNMEHLSEDEKAALLKEEKSRERNRDHSRKSRLRKKEYVEGLKQDVQQLQLYQQLCEQNQDLLALVTSDAKAQLLYASSAFTRVLGYQPHQIVASQGSFLEIVHPENVQEVRSIFQKLTNMGESRKFRFRIKSIDGEYFNAETSARVSDKGVVCSTRVDREI